MNEETVQAAGAVVLRTTNGTTEVLVVHRPRHDDWSLPKGKLDKGEDHPSAAVREVREETGVAIFLRDELDPVSYRDRKDRPKLVRWWWADIDETEAREPDDEVDEVRWVDVDEADGLLTYQQDRDLVRQAMARADGSVVDP